MPRTNPHRSELVQGDVTELGQDVESKEVLVQLDRPGPQRDSLCEPFLRVVVQVDLARVRINPGSFEPSRPLLCHPVVGLFPSPEGPLVLLAVGLAEIYDVARPPALELPPMDAHAPGLLCETLMVGRDRRSTNS